MERRLQQTQGTGKRAGITTLAGFWNTTKLMTGTVAFMFFLAFLCRYNLAIMKEARLLEENTRLEQKQKEIEKPPLLADEKLKK